MSDFNKEELINKIKQNFEDISNSKYLANPIVGFFLSYAKENGEVFESPEDFIYTRKGKNPSVLFHLNIVSFEDIISDILRIDQTEKKIESNYGMEIISPIILLINLLQENDLDFEILLTFKNVAGEDLTNFFDYSIIKSKKVINLNYSGMFGIVDSSSESRVALINIPIERIENDEKISIEILLNSLVGGISGSEIDKQRQNSVKLIVNLIRQMKSKVDFSIEDFNAGDRLYFIPRDAKVKICVENKFKSDLKEYFEIVSDEFITKILKMEPDIKLSYEENGERETHPINNNDFEKLISFIELCPVGIFSTLDDNKLVESSVNISKLRTYEDVIRIAVLIRSNSESVFDEIIEKIKIATNVSKADMRIINDLPLWKRKNKSDIRNLFLNSFENLSKENLEISQTHESLDASLLQNHIDDLDMINFGIKILREGNSQITLADDICLSYNVIANMLRNLD
ncbi:MAG: hypothetical protein SOZ89_01115 [Peptoniphilaceae bacterium]|nr:hypothetical protein [Peptoniphilaceae bacterium]MDY3737703.1 hypothetical protein [Peptoniphilaceae bacterium]